MPSCCLDCPGWWWKHFLTGAFHPKDLRLHFQLLGLDAAWSHHSSSVSSLATTLAASAPSVDTSGALGAWISSRVSEENQEKPCKSCTPRQVAKINPSSIGGIFHKSTGLLENGAHAQGTHALEQKAAKSKSLKTVWRRKNAENFKKCFWVRVVCPLKSKRGSPWTKPTPRTVRSPR